MKRFAKIVGILFVVLIVVTGGAFAWASSTAASRLAKVYETHRVEIPVPVPLSGHERSQIGESDPTAVALERAIERGKHLVESRYACTECHGKDFAGGTMIDDPAIGGFFGPNITLGKGGAVAAYTSSDWDRIVRHGVLPDGRPALMPSIDFAEMSDQELSDIIALIQSMPPVDRERKPSHLGPIGKVLVATEQLKPSAGTPEMTRERHESDPPPTAETVEFGKHMVAVCTGCHSVSLAGGTILGGDPSWPPAANLTQHTEGLAGWSSDDFSKALLTGQSKDGRKLRPPMDGMAQYASKMSSTELKAMWAYLQSVPALPTPGGKLAAK